MRRFIGRHLALIGYLVLLAGFLVVIYQLDRTRVALCAQRSDIDRRIAVSEKLLRQYPNDEQFRRQVGIPRALIESSLRDTKQTRKNFSVIYC